MLKKSFFAMTENSQDRRCVSIAAMWGTISNTAKSTADARIDFTDLAAAGIANMHHLRDFRRLAIFEFFNTIGAKRTFGAATPESIECKNDLCQALAMGMPFPL